MFLNLCNKVIPQQNKILGAYMVFKIYFGDPGWVGKNHLLRNTTLLGGSEFWILGSFFYSGNFKLHIKKFKLSKSFRLQKITVTLTCELWSAFKVSFIVDSNTAVILMKTKNKQKFTPTNFKTTKFYYVHFRNAFDCTPLTSW